MIAANSTPRLTYRNSGAMVSSGRAVRVLDARRPLTAEDLRIHAWINERLSILQHGRHGLWAKVRRLFLGNRDLAA